MDCKQQKIDNSGMPRGRLKVHYNINDHFLKKEANEFIQANNLGSVLGNTDLFIIGAGFVELCCLTRSSRIGFSLLNSLV